MCRATTPTLRSVYLVAASVAPPAGLFSRLRAALAVQPPEDAAPDAEEAFASWKAGDADKVLAGVALST